jgi:hypothetical protein
LGIFLNEAATHSIHEAGAAPQLAAAVGAWLAEVPIPPYNAPDSGRLRCELGKLGEQLFRTPGNRELFARRLLEHWHQSTISLEEVLSVLGYPMRVVTQP